MNVIITTIVLKMKIAATNIAAQLNTFKNGKLSLASQIISVPIHTWAQNAAWTKIRIQNTVMITKQQLVWETIQKKKLWKF